MGFWYCQWELGFDVANENWVLNSANVSWVFDVANENWVLMFPMKIEFWYCQWELGFDVANENWALDK